MNLGAGQPPPHSSPPPHPPDPVELRRRRLVLEKEELEAWRRNLRKTTAAYLAEMEAFRVEMRNELRQLALRVNANPPSLLDGASPTIHEPQSQTSLATSLRVQPPGIHNESPIDLSPPWKARCKLVARKSTAPTGGVKKPRPLRLGTVATHGKYQKQKPQFQCLLSEIATVSTQLKKPLASSFTVSGAATTVLNINFGSNNCDVDYVLVANEVGEKVKKVKGESPDDMVMVSSGGANECCHLVVVDVRQEIQRPNSCEEGREPDALHLFDEMLKSNGSCYSSCGSSRGTKGDITGNGESEFQVSEGIGNVMWKNDAQSYFKDCSLVDGSYVGDTPLVELLNFFDTKVQRAAAGALKILVFKDDCEEKQMYETSDMDQVVNILPVETTEIESTEAVSEIVELLVCDGNLGSIGRKETPSAAPMPEEDEESEHGGENSSKVVGQENELSSFWAYGTDLVNLSFPLVDSTFSTKEDQYLQLNSVSGDSELDNISESSVSDEKEGEVSTVVQVLDEEQGQSDISSLPAGLILKENSSLLNGEVLAETKHQQVEEILTQESKSDLLVNLDGNSSIMKDQGQTDQLCLSSAPLEYSDDKEEGTYPAAQIPGRTYGESSLSKHHGQNDNDLCLSAGPFVIENSFSLVGEVLGEINNQSDEEESTAHQLTLLANLDIEVGNEIRCLVEERCGESEKRSVPPKNDPETREIKTMSSVSLCIDSADSFSPDGILSEVIDDKENLTPNTLLLRSLKKKNVYVGNALLCMYAKCGVMSDAMQVFGDMAEPNEVTFTAMMGELKLTDKVAEALEMFRLMCRKGVCVDSVSLSSMLGVCAKGCGESGVYDHCDGVQSNINGQQIHGLTVKLGFEGDLHLNNSLLDMYAKSADMKSAEKVFASIPEVSIVSSNVMITGYGLIFQSQKAIEYLRKMQSWGFEPDEVTYINLLAACAKSGDVNSGRQMFDKISRPNVISWNAILSGYFQTEDHTEVIKLFREMQFRDVQPDQTTLAIALSFSAAMGILEGGKEIHAASHKVAFDADVYVASALIGTYSKCGKTEMAKHIFHSMQELDVVCWNSMIAGLSLNSQDKEAFTYFKQMRQHEMLPTQFSYATILSCCAKLASSFQGKQVHGQITKDGYVSDVFVGSALIGMYCKCGDVDGARKYFNTMPSKSTVTWNEMIHGYAQNRRGGEAVLLYWDMIASAERPDAITFVAVDLLAILSIQVLIITLEDKVQCFET